MSAMYAILRVVKHKSIAAVARSARHTFREQPTPNANSDNASKNRFAGCRDTKDLISKLSDRLPVKRRRDAVLCIEYLITASPEAFSRRGGHLDDLGSGFFSDALSWLQARHGKDNVVCAAIHLDETTPHLIAYVVPLTPDGRLSAREFLGGPTAMRAMQDDFYQACGQTRGLLRGIQGSKACHSKISQFYSVLRQDEPYEQLTAIDYMAKSLGHQTLAWKKAQALAQRQVQRAAVDSLQRKSVRSRTQALACAEKHAQQEKLRLRKTSQDQDKRERLLKRREEVVSQREPELDIAVARAEALERLLDDRDKKESTVQYQYSPKQVIGMP